MCKTNPMPIAKEKLAALKFKLSCLVTTIEEGDLIDAVSQIEAIAQETQEYDVNDIIVPEPASVIAGYGTSGAP